MRLILSHILHRFDFSLASPYDAFKDVELKAGHTSHTGYHTASSFSRFHGHHICCKLGRREGFCTGCSHRHRTLLDFSWMHGIRTLYSCLQKWFLDSPGHVLFRSHIYPINLSLQAAEMDRTKFRGVNLGGTMGPMDLERGGRSPAFTLRYYFWKAFSEDSFQILSLTFILWGIQFLWTICCSIWRLLAWSCLKAAKVVSSKHSDCKGSVSPGERFLIAMKLHVKPRLPRSAVPLLN
jgi:hypothetical protein